MNVPDYGAFVLSLDFELHWGVRDHTPPDSAYRAQLLATPQAIEKTLELFSRYNVAATWATVGMLFAENRQELIAYQPERKPAYLDRALDPYQEPVGENEQDDPLHYAPSLVRRIHEAPRQELASHTFAHYYCTAPGQRAADFDADLASAVTIAQDKGMSMRSIILPRNQINPDYAALLLKHGIDCYRGTGRGRMYRLATSGPARRLRRLERLLDSYLPLSRDNLINWQDIPEPGGLYNVPLSRFLRPASHAVLDKLQLRRISGELEAAARQGKLYHLWWHPHNFGAKTEQNLALLASILKTFTRLSTRYGMRSLNMSDVAETLGAPSLPDPAPKAPAKAPINF